MPNSDFEKIDSVLRSQGKTFHRLAGVGLVLTVLSCAIGLFIVGPRIPLLAPVIIVVILISGLIKVVGNMLAASAATSILRCTHCGSLNTSLKEVTGEYFDTTETETKRTTHYSSEGEEIGYSETNYEVPGTSAIYTSKHKCAACSKESAHRSSKDLRDLINSPQGGQNNTGFKAFPYLLVLFILTAGYFARPFTYWLKPSARAANHDAPPPLPINFNSKINLHGVGSVTIGMSLEEASAAAGHPLVNSNDGDSKNSCYIATLEHGPDGLLFMIHDNQVARIYITNDRFATLSNGRVGQTVEHLQGLYGGKLQQSNDINAHTLSYIPKDRSDESLRILFFSDGEVIKGISVGRIPEIEWDEGCD